MAQKRVRPSDIEIVEVGSDNPAVGKALRAALRVEARYAIPLADYDKAGQAKYADLETQVKVYLRKQVMDHIYGDLKTFARQARVEFLKTSAGMPIGFDHPGIKLLDMLLRLADEEPAIEPQPQEVSS